MSKVTVKGADINIIQQHGHDYIPLTDMVKKTNGDQLIKNWLKNKNTIEFLGIWERLNNPNFNLVDFDLIRLEAGTNRFLMSVNQWVEKTNAIGIMAKAGRYGGTYAHKDIAFEFGTWISPEFKLLLIKEFQRLKEDESKLKNAQWDYRRFLTKVNYKIHTDSIKDNLIPISHVTKEQEGIIYASEAEILNMAVFNITSKEWKQKNPDKVLKGLNIRDLADVPQLTVLANLESHNADMIKSGISGIKRLIKLRELAITQLKSLRSITYTYPIESPYLTQPYEQTSTFDQNLKGLLNVPPPQKDK